jgi:chemotaxis-related protein WspD
MIDDCWNRIGVYGDGSCPKLREHVHCRNCPVYSSAAASLLDVEAPAGYLRGLTGIVAQGRPPAAPVTHSAVVFRIAEERLAFSTANFREIADTRAIHSLPHRRGGVVLGLVGVRGELIVCVSLRKLLGLPAGEDARPTRSVWDQRLLVVEREANRFAIPVDEVYGVERYREADLQPAPIAERAGPTYATSVLSWENHSVGLLDDELLFQTLGRSLSSTRI